TKKRGGKSRDSFSGTGAAGLAQDIARREGIVGVHWVKGVDVKPNTPTVKTQLQNKTAAKCEWILLIEAAEVTFLQALRMGACSEAVLRGLSPGATVERGVYRLQYELTHSELGRTG